MERIFDRKPKLGVHEIFQAAKDTSSHERLLKKLYLIFCDSPHSKFILEFVQCLAVIFTYSEKQLQVDRSLDFAAKYCVYHGTSVGEDENVLLLAVFEFIFDNIDRKLQAIRSRASEFLNRLLRKMGPQAALDNDIFEKMASNMLKRLQDKVPTIRAQAVMALQRLQDPADKQCRITKALSYHLEADPSCDVRTRVVQNIAVTVRTLPLIIGRLQDSKDVVRREAFKVLSKIKPQKLTIKQRQIIFSSSITDKSDSVKTLMKKTLIPSWFKSCNSNLLDFLAILDVVTLDPDTVDNVLKQIYEEIPDAELSKVVERLEEESGGRRVIPMESLKPESAVLWRSIVEHLGFDASEAHILPELVQFAKYISLYSGQAKLNSSADDQYILKQLIGIAKCYSFVDDMGRRLMVTTCEDILKGEGTGLAVIPTLVSLIELLVPSPEARLRVIAELITDIREPLEADHPPQEKEMDWEAKEAKRDTPSPTGSATDMLAEGLAHLKCDSQSLDECTRAEKTDPETQLKCLTIIKEILNSPSVSKVDATLISLKEYFIMDCLKSDDGRVLSLAADTLAALSVRSLHIAKEFFPKFLIQVANECASVSAIEAIFDILLVHGFEPFSFGVFSDNGMVELVELSGEGTALDFTKDDTMSPGTQKLVSLLTSLLTSRNSEVKLKVCEGLSKLLYSGRIDSHVVLAHLTVLWFLPQTENEPLISQHLGMFFTSFSSRRVGAPDIILRAFSPTLRAANEQACELFDSLRVANLFLMLLRPDISAKVSTPKENEGSYHGRLALIILNEIREEMIPLHILTRSLGKVQLVATDFPIKQLLVAQADRAIKWLSKSSGEKRLVNIVKKFRELAERLEQPEKDETVVENSTSQVLNEEESEPKPKRTRRKGEDKKGK